MTDISSDLSSSELSSAPQSPQPPPDFSYPTPTSSQESLESIGSQVSNLCSERDVDTMNADEDPAPARKRRKVEPKPRVRRTLDLTSDDSQSQLDQKNALDLLLKTIRTRKKIVVVAGAGISVSAGIPDFRSAHGLFNGLKKKHKLKGSGKGLFDASVYKDDNSTSSFHEMVRDMSSMAAEAQPTIFHRLLARLSKEKRLLRLYTQNIDGIDTSLPPLATAVPLNHKAPWPQTIQLHGGLDTMMCQKCQQTAPLQAELFDGAKPPSCPKCVESDRQRTDHQGKRSHGIGKLRPRIVLYNEAGPDEDAIGSVVTADLRARPDCILVVGTSMKIPGVKRIVREMCGVVRGRRDGVAIWLNLDPVPALREFEDCWDLVIKGNSDQVAKLVDLKEWDDETNDLVEDVSLSDVEKIKKRQGSVQVLVPETPRKPKQLHPEVAGILTPPVTIDDSLRDIKTPTKLKLTIKPPKPVSATNNPASKGRPIAEIINKENKTKRKRAAPSANQAQIVGKISKTITRVTKKEKVAKKVVVKPDTPLAPLQAPNPTALPELVSATPSVSSPQEWTAPETVTPTGGIPSGMADLLH